MKKHGPLTEERLFEIKARAKAATPGPWYHVLAAIVGTTPRPDDDNTTCICNTEWGNATNVQSNASFIAAAREDVPALLAEVERLREEVARLRKQLDGLKKIAAFSIGCTSHPQWEKKYKLQWGMEIFEKIGTDNVIKNFRKFYRELPF